MDKGGTKPNDLNLIPRYHMVEGENQPPTIYPLTSMYTEHTKTNIWKKESREEKRRRKGIAKQYRSVSLGTRRKRCGSAMADTPEAV